MGDAYGEEEVYYCAVTDAVGFDFNEKLRKYEARPFIRSKFKIKFDRTAKTREIKGHEEPTTNGRYTCNTPFSGSKQLLACKTDFYHLSFNSNNGRFAFAMLFGYVGGRDSIHISYGTCDKF